MIPDACSYRQLSRRLNLEPDPVMYKELSDNFNATLDVYDQILGKQKYIAGDVSQRALNFIEH